MTKKKPKEEHKKSGAPTTYKKEYAKQVYKFCLLGSTDVQLADFFGVCEKTINNWKKEHPKFLQAIKDGKEKADSEIASALFYRAKGYKHKEDKIFNNNGEALIVPTVKHYPPDTAAAFIWLKNRSGWKDKQEVEATTTVVDVSDDPEEVARRLAFLLRKGIENKKA